MSVSLKPLMDQRSEHLLNATTYCKSIVQPGAKPYVAFRAFVGIGKIIDFNQVRYFLAVANTVNFTRAAKQCYVSQPAFTQAIRRLEAELGGELIHRDGRYTMLS